MRILEEQIAALNSDMTICCAPEIAGVNSAAVSNVITEKSLVRNSELSRYPKVAHDRRKNDKGFITGDLNRMSMTWREAEDKFIEGRNSTNIAADRSECPLIANCDNHIIKSIFVNQVAFEVLPYSYDLTNTGAIGFLTDNIKWISNNATSTKISEIPSWAKRRIKRQIKNRLKNGNDLYTSRQIYHIYYHTIYMSYKGAVLDKTAILMSFAAWFLSNFSGTRDGESYVFSEPDEFISDLHHQPK